MTFNFNVAGITSKDIEWVGSFNFSDIFCIQKASDEEKNYLKDSNNNILIDSNNNTLLLKG